MGQTGAQQSIHDREEQPEVSRGKQEVNRARSKVGQSKVELMRQGATKHMRAICEWSYLQLGGRTKAKEKARRGESDKSAKHANQTKADESTEEVAGRVKANERNLARFGLCGCPH